MRAIFAPGPTDKAKKVAALEQDVEERPAELEVSKVVSFVPSESNHGDGLGAQSVWMQGSRGARDKGDRR